MASRKEQKEQARSARIAQQQATAAQAQRTRRIQIFGGAIAIAVIVIVVAIVVSSGGSNTPKNASTGLATGTKLVSIKNSVNSTLGTIPQSGTTLGNPKAPVTMQYFGDLECPICQAFTLMVFPTFVQQEVKTGHVKVVYRSMCTATCDGKRAASLQQAQFNSQQVAAYAAGKQNKFWNYAELFYHQQGSEGTGYANDAYLTGLAKQIPGLKVSTWQNDRNDAGLKAQVAADGVYATKAALPGTPTLIMSGKKGTEIVPGSYQGVYAFPSPSELAKAVQNVS
jgi:protein-disulfide isomerase